MKEFFTRERTAFFSFFLVLNFMRAYVNSFKAETDLDVFIIVLALFVFAMFSAGLMAISCRKESERLWSFSAAAYAASLTALAMILLVFTANGTIVLAGSVLLYACITLFFTGSGLFLTVLTE